MSAAAAQTGTDGVAFTVYGPAQPAGSKVAGRTKDGRMFVRDDAKRSRPWKTQVAQAAGEAMNGAPLFDGPLSLCVRFYMPRPKGHFGANGLLPSAPLYPTVRPDVTKLLRAIEDALTGIIWRDDSQVVAQHALKGYGEPACAEIEVGTL
jgi:Holliday junction resolvase RusA-like endonuclease